MFAAVLAIAGCTYDSDPHDRKVPVTGVSISCSDLTVKEGESATLTATIAPQNATNKNVFWDSEDMSIAIVDGDGEVTGIKEGVCTVTVTTEDGNYKANCKVTVTSSHEVVHVLSIALDKDKIDLTEDESATLKATVKPSNADNKKVIWTSSDESVATVDQNGNVTAVGEGVAIITATTEDGGKTATCEVTVYARIPVTGVSIDVDSLGLTNGSTSQRFAIVEPFYATNQDVIWSSDNEKVVTVDEEGNVKAVSEGTAHITVTTVDGGYTDTCVVTVVKKEDVIPVKGVTLNKIALDLSVYESYDLIATIYPSNATNKGVTWKSSNTSVVEVRNGNVKAMAPGTAVVTVTTEDGNHSASCVVIVTYVPMLWLALDHAIINLDAGSTQTLKATVTPSTATYQKLTWKSSNTAVATVDQKGKVTAIAEGTAIVTVTAEDLIHSASCIVYVTKGHDISVTGVTLNHLVISIKAGEDFPLTATISPDNATNKNVTWSSSDTSVAKVDKNGLVHGVAAGVAIVTVTTEDGHHTASCAVTVTPSSDDVDGNAGIDDWGESGEINL